MPTHVMVDLETLAKNPGSAISSIGAVAFDPRVKGLPPLAEMLESTGKFYTRVNLSSCLDLGLSIEGSTVAWWLRQDEEARTELGSAILSGGHIRDCLWLLRKWLQEVKPNRIWSHGSTFDLPILSYAMYKCGMQEPWDYRALRDTRTLFDLANYSYKSAPVGKHNALVDAYHQALAVQDAYAILVGKEE